MDSSGDKEGLTSSRNSSRSSLHGAQVEVIENPEVSKDRPESKKAKGRDEVEINEYLDENESSESNSEGNFVEFISVRFPDFTLVDMYDMFIVLKHRFLNKILIECSNCTW